MTAVKDKLRTRIVEAAESILVRHGRDDLTARRLAKAAGCSVGTIYNVFTDLDDVAIAVHARTLARLEQSIAEVTLTYANAPLIARMQAAAKVYLAFSREHATCWHALSDYRLPEDREPPQAFSDQRDRVIGCFEQSLRSDIADVATARRLAQVLHAAIGGVIVMAADRKHGLCDAAEIDARVELLVAAIGRHVAAA